MHGGEGNKQRGMARTKFLLRSPRDYWDFAEILPWCLCLLKSRWDLSEIAYITTRMGRSRRDLGGQKFAENISYISAKILHRWEWVQSIRMGHKAQSGWLLSAHFPWSSSLPFLHLLCWLRQDRLLICSDHDDLPAFQTFKLFTTSE